MTAAFQQPSTTRLAPGVRVYPAEDDGPWTVKRPDGTYLRVGRDMGRLLQALDGRSTAELAEALGAAWSAESVEYALTRARKMNLLPVHESSTASVPSATERRVRFQPPLTVQFTLIRPTSMARRLQPLLRRVPRVVFAAAAVLFSVGGLLALSFQTVAVRETLSRPLPLWVLVSSFLTTTLVTGIHEFGHGLALARYGAIPSRMGFMLFYLTPTFFCDVSDGWRLPRRSQRVVVALAGIATQLTIGGIFALVAAPVATFLGDHSWTSLFIVVALSTYTASAVNLIPFVKFDGYIALMAHLDLPFLRERATKDARSVLARWIFGGEPQDREFPQFRWSILLFGLACLVAPIFLVATALAICFPFLLAMGLIGRVLLVVVLLLLVFRFVRSTWLAARASRAAGARPVRQLTGGLMMAVTIVAVLVGVRLPSTVEAGFECTADGARLVVAEAGPASRVHAGHEVLLMEQGLVRADRLGTARVVAGPDQSAAARHENVSIRTLVPVSDLDFLVDAWTFPLSSCPAESPRFGAATVMTGMSSLGEVLWRSFFSS